LYSSSSSRDTLHPPSFPTRRSSDLDYAEQGLTKVVIDMSGSHVWDSSAVAALDQVSEHFRRRDIQVEIVGLNEPSAHLHEELSRSEEHTSELQSRFDLVCRLLLEKK